VACPSAFKKKGGKSLGELKNTMNKEKALSGAFKEKLATLRNKGLIKYTIPDKPKSSKQKYRLTELGEKILRER
jgi:DNA-binding HxlR family transcriptional regulator